MKHLWWSFHNIRMPMMEDDSGRLFCVSAALCQALGISEDTLRHIHQRHPDDFEGLNVTDCHAKDFLREHKAAHGIQRVRGDMRLWSEQDMVAFAMLSRSDVSVDFRRQLNQFVRENARRDYVPRETYDAAMTELATLRAKNDALEVRVDRLERQWPTLDKLASAAGSVLANHRGLQPIGDN